MEIQSVLLNKKYFKNRKEAQRFIRKIKFRPTINPDPNPESKNLYRFRQIQPEKFVKNSFRTKKINDVISLVVGKLKKRP